MRHYSWLKTKHTTFLYKFVRFLAFWAFTLIYKNKIYGLRHIPKGPGLIAANHTSFLDPPVVSISFPEEVHFLARKTLFKNPLFGALIRNLNSHPVSGQAEDIAVFKTIVGLLKQNKKVIIFPEGQRTSDGKIREIKPGISLLLSRTDAAIHSVLMYTVHMIFGAKKDLFQNLKRKDSSGFWQSYLL
jgi:1-acyl-sn-glycerol-3-phosphate acyltransferase